MLFFKDLRGKVVTIPSSTFSFAEELKIYICKVYTHIEPYTVRICVDGIFLNKLDKLPQNKIIYIWQTCSIQKYKVSDVFDALSQINGVFYSETCNLMFNYNYYTSDVESSDSDDSFHSANEN